MCVIILQSNCFCNFDAGTGVLGERDFVEDLPTHSVLKTFILFKEIFSFRTGSGYSVIIKCNY